MRVFALSIAAILPFEAARPQVAPQDSLALVALYNSTNGPNWTDRTGWLTAPLAQWKGVGVTGDRVTSLDLHFNSLSGTIPPELGDLTRLVLLDLQSNQLAGTIPPQLGGMDSLRSLILPGNQLSGNIPQELGGLSELQILWLFNNQLGGSIPPEMGNLVSLKELYLDGNRLTGSIPPQIGGLSSLEFLTMPNNELTGSIPGELGSLTRLRALWLHGNQLTGSIPSELGDLANLTILDLHDNPLSGTIPMSFTALSMMATFDFSGTGLCSSSDSTFQTWLQGIAQLRGTGCTTGAERFADLPGRFKLGANYPNPFNPRTTIPFFLAERSRVRLSVYDATGRLVEVLTDAVLAPGEHRRVFEANDLAGGAYFVRLETGSLGHTGRMTLVK